VKIEIKHISEKFPAYDRTFLRDVPREYGALAAKDMKDAVVLDIGGHIGIFSALAVNAGAKKVIYVEPSVPAITLARKNLAPAVEAGIVEMIHAGVTANPKLKKLVLRYFADLSGMAGATTVPSADWGPRHWRHRPYTFEERDTVLFSALLAKYEPAVIKLDCEGMEYACLRSIKKMPAHVRAFTAEWHKTAGRFGVQGYLECTAKLRAWGFKPDKVANITPVYDAEGVAIGSNQRFLRPIRWSR